MAATPLRNFRCPDDRWNTLLERSALTPSTTGKPVTATDVIIAALDAYLQTPIVPLPVVSVE